MFETIANHKGNKFYKVKTNSIESAQESLGIVFPKDLIEFYKQVGYGFLKSEKDNFNRIMDPESVAEFRLRTGQFANYSGLDIYDAYERDQLVFFEICEGCYISIGFTKNNYGKIFYGKKRIADSLEEFLIKYQDDENYF